MSTVTAHTGMPVQNSAVFEYVVVFGERGIAVNVCARWHPIFDELVGPNILAWQIEAPSLV